MCQKLHALNFEVQSSITIRVVLKRGCKLPNRSRYHVASTRYLRQDVVYCKYPRQVSYACCINMCSYYISQLPVTGTYII